MTTKNTKRSREGLTEEKIFQLKYYLNIMTLLHLSEYDRPKGTYKTNRPMRLAHLQELLVVSKDCCEKKLFGSSFIDLSLRLPITINRCWFPDYLFKSKYGLRRALTRLKHLKIVESYKPEKIKRKQGYYHLRFTELGRILYMKFLIQTNLKYIDDLEKLKEISGFITYLLQQDKNPRYERIMRETVDALH